MMAFSAMMTSPLSSRTSSFAGGSGDTVGDGLSLRSHGKSLAAGAHRSTRKTRHAASSSSGRGGEAARCELLDWSSYGKSRSGGTSGVDDRKMTAATTTTTTVTTSRRQQGLYLPEQPQLVLPHHENDKMVGDSSSRAPPHAKTQLSRRGLLMASTAASTVAAVDLAFPRPSSAFIDLPSRLHNRYFLVRHGESQLDVRGVILSNPSYKYDTTYGLTVKGINQMHRAAAIISDEYDGAPSWLYTSNFQRSFQSALILREDLGLLFSQLRTEFSGLLDPRKMGALDFGNTSSLPAVWEGDAKDVNNTPPPVPASLQPSASVESPRDVFRRALEAFTRLEATYFGEDVILVRFPSRLADSFLFFFFESIVFYISHMATTSSDYRVEAVN